MKDNPSQNETKPETDNQNPRPKKSLWGILSKLLLFLVVLIGLLIGADAAYKHWFVAKVDDDDLSHGTIVIGDSSDDPAEVATGITAGFDRAAIDAAENPLDPALILARRGLEHMDSTVRDYTATMIKQIRYQGKLLDTDHMEVKIRNAHEVGDTKVPFSAYTKMITPASKAGIEAIYVDTWNNGYLVAHINGLFNVKRHYLDPNGFLAMREQLHPITLIGIRNLLVQVIDKGERHRKIDTEKECVIEFSRNVEVEGRKCMLIEIRYPEKREGFEFHITKIFIDLELDVPICYEGYSWPEEAGGEPLLFERYIYSDLKLNVGLTDEDFDPANENYGYPAYPAQAPE